MTPDTAVVELESRIGYRFNDVAVLRNAMAHRSWCAEHRGVDSNERLEFLGDSVLGWVVTDLIYRRYTDQHEGQLTNLRKALVNAHSLAAIARDLDVGSALLLGRGEERSGGRTRTSILADALEAIIGAVYLDGGVDAARSLVVRLVEPRVNPAATGQAFVDHKTVLQERATRQFSAVPRYDVRDDGPDHAKRFFAEVRVGDGWSALGEGGSKKLAEQDAARNLLALFPPYPNAS
jgi:ribonuclease III